MFEKFVSAAPHQTPGHVTPSEYEANHSQCSENVPINDSGSDTTLPDEDLHKESLQTDSPNQDQKEESTNKKGQG